MFSVNKLPYLYLVMLMLIFALVGFRAVDKTIFAQFQMTESNGTPVLDKYESYPVMQFVGRSFDEIKQQLGEPHEQGYSSWLGAHNYMLYCFKDGYIRFGSPLSEKTSIATSIIIGPGQEVLGAKVGMDFTEIIAILGEPDFGPEPGLNNQFYMGYSRGKINDQVPDLIISFSADGLDAPTRDLFIKWEGYAY